jgi:hypothetical protein
MGLGGEKVSLLGIHNVHFHALKSMEVSLKSQYGIAGARWSGGEAGKGGIGRGGTW